LAGPIARWPTGVESLRRIDWKNLEYPFHTGEGEWVRLENGRAGSLSHHYSIEFRDVVFGDLTGDGTEEAVLRLREYDGGSMGGHDMWTEIITLVDGRPLVLETLADGDDLLHGDASGATLDLQIKKGRLLRCLSLRAMSSMGLAKGGPGPPWRLQTWRWDPEGRHVKLLRTVPSQCGKGKEW
jgi:hypothetical protein